MGREQRSKEIVWLIESHPLAARLIQQILNRRRNIRMLIDADLPTRTASGARPSVFVIDGEGLAIALGSYLHSIRVTFPEARILLLGNPLPSDELCRLLLLGIHGFVSYARVQDLDAAIQAVSGGHLWASQEVLEQFALYLSKLVQPKRDRRQTLTPREELVVGLLQRRLSNKEIGSALSISERTVRFHLANIFCKLGVHDRHSVVEVAKSRMSSAIIPYAPIHTFK